MTSHETRQGGTAELRERVRDFIYDCTKDGFGHGWTLSAEQTDHLIKLARGDLA